MIYLDNAATTPLDSAVFEEMKPYFTQKFGNPQSGHAFGREAAIALGEARDGVADILGCKSQEVYFLSGGTEAGNTALKGVCAHFKKGHLIVSAIEHPALTESAEDMKRFGFEVTFVKPDGRGIVSAEAVEKAIRPDTVFCAVMAVNNEVGTIQPFNEIGRLCKERGIFYYCDCVQAAGVLPIKSICCDALGISAHKFYGPKGAGALYIRENSPISRLISGGRQERAFRGGTVNTAAAVGLFKALEIAERDREENCKKIQKLRDGFLKRTLTEISGTHLNGDKVLRVPSNANISFDGCGGDNLLFLLDIRGVAASAGSACSAGAVKPSPVLLSMGLGESRASSAVRFTFGRQNTAEEVDFAVEALKESVNKIRFVKN